MCLITGTDRNAPKLTATHRKSQTNRKSSKSTLFILIFYKNLCHLKDVFKVNPFGKFYEDPMRRLGVLCKNILMPPDRTHRQTHRQTDTKVNTEDTLSGFQEFFLQPIIKDRCNTHNAELQRAQKSRGNSVGVVFSHTMPKMDFRYSHRFS